MPWLEKFSLVKTVRSIFFLLEVRDHFAGPLKQDCAFGPQEDMAENADTPFVQFRQRHERDDAKGSSLKGLERCMDCLEPFVIVRVVVKGWKGSVAILESDVDEAEDGGPVVRRCNNIIKHARAAPWDRRENKRRNVHGQKHGLFDRCCNVCLKKMSLI